MLVNCPRCNADGKVIAGSACGQCLDGKVPPESEAMFHAIYQGKHGPSVAVDNPKLEAYKQMADIQNRLGLTYRTTYNEDGSVTVAGDGLAPITFEATNAHTASNP